MRARKKVLPKIVVKSEYKGKLNLSPPVFNILITKFSAHYRVESLNFSSHNVENFQLKYETTDEFFRDFDIIDFCSSEFHISFSNEIKQEMRNYKIKNILK